jgi:hypothetical protein
MRKGKRFLMPESICDTKSCKFYGKPAAQGVCYSKIDTGMEKYFNRQLERAEEHLKFYKDGRHLGDKKKKQSKDEYIKTLESHFVCTWMNYTNTLDELIWLRGENAKMRLMLGKWNGSRRNKPIK